ncbi:MAG: M14 family metallopeptidase [Lachnospiraceae bacterium]|nr:M14 family metallopeptidase [Lachnospiraceae bacterium]
MKRRTLFELESLYRDHMRVTGFDFGVGEKSACIVGAMRGNEVQQLYCCAKLIQTLTHLEKKGLIVSGKSIRVIPCVNSAPMNIEKRFWATDNTDINRMFPGYNLGETTQRIAGGVFEQISDYTYGMQFVSSYIPGKYIPHVRMMKTGFENAQMATAFGFPYVVLRDPRPFDTATLNYNWQLWNCHAFSIYTDATDRVHEESAVLAVEAILRFLCHEGILQPESISQLTPGMEDPEILLESDETIVKSNSSGFLQLKKDINDPVEAGEVIAEILNPYDCSVAEEVKAPKKGLIFYTCQKPMIHTT